MKKTILLCLIFISLLLVSCSSSIEETREEEETGEEDTYVFDEIPERDNETISISNEIYYQVQIGAFTTKQNAEYFAAESKKILGRNVNVDYSSDVNLFTVRIDNKFRNKSEAERLRDEIRQKEDFKDAWVVTIFR